MIKEQLCAATGAVGGFIAALLGGWDTGLQTLVLFMCMDYLTGLIVAGIFHKSTKTESGALESKAGFKGLCRKAVILLIVVSSVATPLVLKALFTKMPPQKHPSQVNG